MKYKYFYPQNELVILCCPACALSTLLVIRRILNTAIDYGDGDVITLVVKVLYPIFKANGMEHYAIMRLEMIAQLFSSTREVSIDGKTRTVFQHAW